MNVVTFFRNTGRDVIHPLSASAYHENVLDLGSLIDPVFSGGHPPLMGGCPSREGAHLNDMIMTLRSRISPNCICQKSQTKIIKVYHTAYKSQKHYSFLRLLTLNTVTTTSVCVGYTINTFIAALTQNAFSSQITVQKL